MRKNRKNPISVYGIDEKNKNIIMKAVEFYKSELMLDSVKIYISINITKLDRNCGGFLQIQPIIDITSPNPNYFTIYINNALSLKLMCSTLAHEMSHVKQYFNGELKLIFANIKNFKELMESKSPTIHAYWKNVNLGDVDQIPYSSCPWEVEAHTMCDELFKKFVEFFNKGTL
jgi:hypothetical protein